MTTLFDCVLGGVTLSSLDKSICVTDVREEAPVYREALTPAWLEGQRLLSRTRESLSVTVRFAIHEDGLARRSEVLRAVYAWAENGGALTISSRPGQRLQVICTALPDLSCEDWLEELTLRFTTSHTPWWETSAVARAAGNSIMTLDVPGNAPSPAPVEVMVINEGADTIHRLKLHCGLTEMVFDGIDLPAGSYFSLLYRDGIMIAWIDGESVLSRRTPQSADRLLAPCGQTSTVYVDGEELLHATFSARGRCV